MLNIGDNIAVLERQLSDAMLEQLPFAAARALNDTATDVADAWRESMERQLDRPTPFTLRGPHLQRRARKTRLTAVAAVRPIQAEYLRIQVTGGTRRPDGSAILVPVGARRNRYGNLTRNYIRTLLNSGRGFVASRNDPRTANLPPGIYRRRRRGSRTLPPELMVAFEDSAQYRPIWDAEGVAMHRARTRWPGHLAARLRQAWATRR